MYPYSTDLFVSIMRRNNGIKNVEYFNHLDEVVLARKKRQVLFVMLLIVVLLTFLPTILKIDFGKMIVILYEGGCLI